MASSSSSSLSSSSSKKNKTLFKKPNSASSSSRATSLIKRQATVFKKAEELSILCGIDVCVICYMSDGKLKTWPEDREKVKAIARRYGELSETKRRKGSVDLHEFLERINKDDSTEKEKKKIKVRRVSRVKYPVWDPRFDNYSVEQLTGLVQSLERNLTRIQHRTHAVVEAQGQRRMQYTNMANQELMMAHTMNQLQQHSNQVSMYLWNHDNGSFSQIPVSALASNQAQSLAPIPSELMIYPNSDVGNYSGSLGVQGTGINGLQNMNMLTYNNINSVNDFSKQIDQNSRVESYSSLLGVHEYGNNEFENTNMSSRSNFNVQDYAGLLGVEGTVTGTNGLQSMNMHDYNNNNNNNINANGLQFPRQQSTAAPGFQFGPIREQY
ncbi:Transcription factor MADS-box [Arabidopsis thaliana x Arabidopsis arenosa]|uniref:Transcription factor MADS-box n=1 Tax=Arabidopsis thaliana x Arabidopsis arenosa TaxID=1240361 RepID=A0A8T2AWZ4_9BRAS|nr:Transcription factor MADS-box [Arabidopsis thaliana x Arabidopsis arenosa]